MWLAVAMAACVLGVCLALTNFSKNSKQRLSVIDAVFYIPSCFCQQGQMANILYELFIHFYALSFRPLHSYLFRFVGYFFHSFSNS
jgi:hypothetical protein